MDNYIVYLLTDKNNGKIYIGLTHLKLKQRWCNSKLCDRFGHSDFNKEILFSHLNEDGAVWYEKAMIFEHDSTNPNIGYNKSKGGGHVPDETRKKMSRDRKGKKKSEEHRKKLTEANRKKAKDPVFKESHRKGTTIANKDNGKRERSSKSHKLLWENEEFRNERTLIQQRVSEDPKWKKKQKKGIQDFHKKNKWGWWTNGKEDKKIIVGDIPPNGFWRGRTNGGRKS
jgi:hypothetical protein